MKVKFAVCDDEELVCEIIATRALKSFAECGVETEMKQYASPSAVLKDCQTEKFDLLLLDIDMPKLDGIRLASEIKKLENPPEVIFVSGREDRVFDSFRAQPFRFVRKSKFKQELQEAIQAYIDKTNREGKTILLYTKNCSEVENVVVKDIVYIESYRNQQSVFLNGNKEPLLIYSTMDELENNLKEYNVVRVHRGYIVNYAFVARITPSDIELTTGKVLPISRKKRQEIKNDYLQYLRKSGSVMIDENKSGGGGIL